METRIRAYLRAVRRMLEQAERSDDPRVLLTALGILRLQPRTIAELEREGWPDSTVPVVELKPAQKTMSAVSGGNGAQEIEESEWPIPNRTPILYRNRVLKATSYPHDP